jgi:PDZ domain-containing protein
VLWRLPSNYEILMPATAQSVNPMISAQGHPLRAGRGDLLMTFVSEPDSNMLEELIAHLDPDASLQPLPPKYNAAQDAQQNKQLMLSSEQTAELVALCQLGYKDLCSGGMQVQTIESYSKAAGVLKVGDIIIAVDGHPTITADELRAAIAPLKPGAEAAFTIVRNGKTMTVQVPTMTSPTAPHHTIVGFAFVPAPPMQFPSKLPVDVKIDPGNIGGPSAGLMFTLGVINRLSSTDLTQGQRIAGTGTISLDGTVGAIGGIKQKVIGAQWAGARYFLAPCDGGNYSDASKVVGSKMTLVPVTNLSDALGFLHALGPGGLSKQYKFVTCPAQ